MKKKIIEQIDYGDYPERMDPHLERKLGDTSQNLFGDNPAMPRGSLDVQKIASNRFKKVVDKLREATGVQQLSPNYIRNEMTGEMMRAAMTAIRLEAPHIEQLQELAIKAGLKATETEEGVYNIEAIITGQPGAIDTENFQIEPEELEPEEPEDNNMEFPEFNIDDLTEDEKFELEKHKRNIINGIVQGASKRGHYIFQDPQIKEILDQMNPQLYDAYLKLMSINDFFYFTKEDMIEQMSQTGQGVEGKEEVESDEEGNVNIKAQGLIFPILCHEVIKGLEEAVAMHGLPQDSVTSEKVRSQTDTLSNESMTLRIGPELIGQIRNYLPDEMFDEENFGIKPFFYTLLYKIPAKQFLEIIKNTISDDRRDNTKASDKFREIYMQARTMRQRYIANKNRGQDNGGETNLDVPINQPEPESPSNDIDNAKLAGMGLNALNLELNKAIDSENWELAQKIQRMIERKQRN